MSLLGLDVGTTGCKAAVFSEDGRRLGQAYCEYPTVRPRPSWAELDSRQVWAAVRQAIGRAAASAGGDPVSALAVSALGEAATPVSLDREILGNCVLGCDARGGNYVERLVEAIGAEELYRINPNIAGPNMMAQFHQAGGLTRPPGLTATGLTLKGPAYPALYQVLI